MPALFRRAPASDDTARWITHVVDGVARRFAQPLTLTPYASARPCSARCRFCSETLRPAHGGTIAQTLRPGPDYFDRLRAALAVLRGLPLAYSLSGLEMTDDADWFLALLDTLRGAGTDGPAVAGHVLYTNGAGFARARGADLQRALHGLGPGHVELSRHHDDAAANQRIMRFRDGEPIAGGDVFAATARRLADGHELRLVCLVQRGGIASADDVARYLRWATGLGARAVIFRELSRVGDGYRDTGSLRYVEAARVPLEPLLAACRAAPWWRTLVPVRRTEGYYFWNVALRTRDGVQVIFETSDYAAMHARHAGPEVWKLVLFADGRLCAGWEPDRDVVWDGRLGAGA